MSQPKRKRASSPSSSASAVARVHAPSSLRATANKRQRRTNPTGVDGASANPVASQPHGVETRVADAKSVEAATGKAGGEKRTAFRSILTSPFGVNWPNVTAAQSSTILHALLELLRHPALAPLLHCRGAQRRGRKRGGVGAGPGTAANGPAQPVAVQIGLNSISRLLEDRIVEAAAPDDTAAADSKTPYDRCRQSHSGPSEGQRSSATTGAARADHDKRRPAVPPRLLFVCRADVDPPSLIAHLPLLCCSYNAVCSPILLPDINGKDKGHDAAAHSVDGASPVGAQKSTPPLKTTTRRESRTGAPLVLVPLETYGAERMLSDALQVRRVTALYLDPAGLVLPSQGDQTGGEEERTEQALIEATASAPQDVRQDGSARAPNRNVAGSDQHAPPPDQLVDALLTRVYEAVSSARSGSTSSAVAERNVMSQEIRRHGIATAASLASSAVAPNDRSTVAGAAGDDVSSASADVPAWTGMQGFRAAWLDAAVRHAAEVVAARPAATARRDGRGGSGVDGPSSRRRGKRTQPTWTRPPPPIGVVEAGPGRSAPPSSAKAATATATATTTTTAAVGATRTRSLPPPPPLYPPSLRTVASLVPRDMASHKATLRARRAARKHSKRERGPEQTASGGQTGGPSRPKKREENLKRKRVVAVRVTAKKKSKKGKRGGEGRGKGKGEGNVEKEGQGAGMEVDAAPVETEATTKASTSAMTDSTKKTTEPAASASATRRTRTRPRRLTSRDAALGSEHVGRRTTKRANLSARTTARAASGDGHA